MNNLINNLPTYNLNGYWFKPIPKEHLDYDFLESNKVVKDFNSQGYTLSPLELEYTKWNILTHNLDYDSLIDNINFPFLSDNKLKSEWYFQNENAYGYILNRANLLERKAFAEDALLQLKKFAKRNILIQKIIHLKPQWGFEFHLDYIDNSDCVELINIETNYEDCDKALKMKYKFETIIDTTDLNVSIKRIFDHKSEWLHLDYKHKREWKHSYLQLYYF